MNLIDGEFLEILGLALVGSVGITLLYVILFLLGQQPFEQVVNVIHLFMVMFAIVFLFRFVFYCAFWLDEKVRWTT